MDLLEIVNNRVVPSVHALMIQPFKGIWENDLTEDKSYAMKIFQYIELLCSPKRSNPYYGVDAEDRLPRVKKEVFGHPDAEIDTDILFAVMRYKELWAHSSPSFSLLEDALSGALKVRTWLTNVNLDSVTNSGALKIKPKEVLNALNEVPLTVKRLEQLMIDVQSESFESGKTRADRQPGPYEE